MLRLGLIGLSSGNGHPYSWSAIFNGYDRAAMEVCGYPAIPAYLQRQKFPEDGLSFAKVTHVWTQDPELSRKVARASLIPSVVDHYKDLIGLVDGVLLARDDAENHLTFAPPFLTAGIPIFIDKPLALNMRDAETLFSLQRYPGQIFSCSALRYASELQLTDNDRSIVGDLRYIHAKGPKDWQKYAIHLVDPTLNILGDKGRFTSPQVIRSGHITSLHAIHESGAHIHISTLGDIPIRISIDVVGSNGCVSLQFVDTFSAFRKSLSEFVLGIFEKSVKTSEEQLLRAIYLIEAGVTR